MSEEELNLDAQLSGPWQRHRFMALVGIAILVALFLVGVSLALYATSGTAQLDLSRPGYQSVREQATHSDTFDGFPSDGNIDSGVIDQFRTLYKKLADQATSVDSFGGSAMNDQSLSIDASEAAE